ncbi:hypothetical protein ILYODFUR_008250 [Ilyodon furcidens]|uniref:Uncharacterized protein n=1 Tax=Ilyodon furcidens TaxID=33524 RepID=A0ABV0SV79_9TELE
MRKAGEEESWQAQHEGSYPPGSNTCHQLLPPSCAFIKKPPCASLGNPHALLKECEVNTVCLSLSLPVSPLFPIFSPLILTLSMLCCWQVESGPFSVCLCVCVYTCVCTHRVCQTRRFQHSAQSQGKHCQRERLQCRAPGELDSGRISTPRGRFSAQQPTC